MKQLINRTNRVSERLYLINEPMGGYGEPENSPNHKYSIATGIDRGNGFQGYTSITYFLSNESYASEPEKRAVKSLLKNLGYDMK